MTQAQMQDEGRRERKKRQMRERIFRTSCRYFAERGFHETKVEDITAALDVSSATFFNYFGSKDGLLLELAEALSAGFERWIAELAARPPEQAALPDVQLEIAGAAFADVPPMNRRLFVEVLRVVLPHPSGRKLAAGLRSALEGVIREGQTRGRVRTDLPSGELADIASDMVAGTFTSWVNDPDRSFMDRLRRTVSFLEQSLRPQPS